MQGGWGRLTGPTLAVDAGQTETRAALHGEHGPRLARGPGVGRMDAAAGGTNGVVTTLLRALSALEPLPAAPAALGVGLSGMEAARTDELERLGDALHRALRPRRIAIASDGVTSLFGALAGAPGVVVSAGTGTVALAHDGERWARVDGWGSLLGDAGSAFAIGRAGLDAALREHDGRGGSPALLRSAERELGPAAHIVSRIHRTGAAATTVAGFAPVVVEEAAAGDAVATEIVRGAGRELAVSAATALRRAFGTDEPVPVSYAGNVFRAGAPLLEPFERELAERCPRAELVPPRGDALAGAGMLAARAGTLRPAPGLVWVAG
ncbi:MAG TPA: BadF/BadG/BcrA/BcrD ATPase family protein [Solirubrobacteraceae bacterium]|nr:BadF/BadG/BcrA/BcrD ATPase family protein [Solirubrobacteraceae bacterium]